MNTKLLSIIGIGIDKFYVNFKFCLFALLTFLQLNLNAQTFCANCSSCPTRVTASNPDLAVLCEDELNIAFIIDESGSIGSAASDVEDGVMAFLEDLECTSARVAIIEFNQTARYVVNTYSTISSIKVRMQNYFDGISSVTAPFTGQTYFSNGGTNWQAGFHLVDNLATTPDLVFFFTDGQPTAYTPNSTLPGSSFDYCGDGTTTQSPEIYNPVQLSNKLKGEGAHIFVLGVGAGVTGATPTSYIQAISGTTQYNAAGSGDALNVATSDYAIEPNFSVLQQNLENFATSICPLIVQCFQTPACEGLNNGTITIDFSNDADPPYTVQLNGGSIINTISDPYIFTGLAVGNYTVNATSASVCLSNATCNTSVTNTNIVLSEQHSDIDCFGANNGSINLTVIGGVAPFSYLWTNGAGSNQDPTNLAPGSYSVSVTDVNGCVEDLVGIIITEPSKLDISATSIDNYCNGGNFGSINLSVSGGTIPYIFAWSNGASSEDIGSLVAGNYTVIITDGNGCLKDTLITISQPSPPTGSAPCDCAQRWTEGGHWNPDGTINDNGNAPDPKGIIRCGNSADTQSGIETNGCIYNSSQFKIDLTGKTCFSPNTGLPVALLEPVNGCPISWLNFDIRANAGSYEYQIVSNDNIGWALYYSNTHTSGLNSNGLSGSDDCNDLVYWACGNSFDNTWVTFTVPSFTVPTNLYLAVWDLDCTSGCLYQNDLSYNFKARKGCGDGATLCLLEVEDDSTYCNNNGTYTVEIPIVGINGDYVGYDPNATPNYSSIVTLGNIGDGGNVSGTIVMTYPNNVSSFTITIGDSTLVNGDTDPANVDECIATITGVAPVCCDLTIDLISNTNPDCFGESSGSITITSTGTSAPFEYSINGGSNFQSSNIFNNLTAGGYDIVVRSQIDTTCIQVDNTTLIDPALLSLGETHTDVVCNDDNGSSNDGTATITTTNGVAPFSYTINGVTNGTGIFTGLASGQYTAVVTDNSGCTASVSVSIGIAQPITAQETHTDVVCNDDNGSSNDGTATITTTNGVAPFSYTLNGVTNGTGIFTGLASGQYTAVVTDNSGCTASVSVSIGIAQPFTAQESHTDVVCNDDNGSSNDGTATITTTNGIAPFSYTLIGVTNGTGIFTGLASGQYTAVVTDNSGCTASVSVSIGIAQPFTAQESHTDVICNDDNGSSNNGTATITTTNGVAPFSYTLNGVTNGTGIFTGLASGQYTAVVTDNSGCTASVSVSIGIAQPFTAQESHTDVVCNDDNGSSNDGTATITTTNGIAPFSYTLNGVTNGTGIFTGLASGQYTAVVTDNSGCTASVSVSIGIAQPFTAQESHTDVVCNDGSGTSDDGTATITTTNGVAPFSYTLNGVTNGTGVFTGLASGQYTGVVTDATGCTASVSVTINQASALSLSVSHTDVICNDDNGSSNDGTATLTATNGVGQLTYELNGVTNNTGIFTGLSEGVYIGTVVDSNGCSASVSLTIGIAQPFTAQESHTDVVCNDDNGSSNDGTATITTTNGVAPFSYTLNGVTNGTGIFTGLASGQYTAVVTDNSGCTASVSVSIGIAQPFIAQESHTDVVCNDDNGSSNDGTATITTSNGVAPFSYTLSGVTNGTGIFTGLASGQYTAVVTDNSGCTASVSVSIGIAQPFTAQESHTDVICNDDNGSSNDGTATITTTNGVAPFSYTLNGVTNGTGIFTGLASGQYTAVVTDNSGCTASVSVSIGIAQPFTAQESHTDVVCNDDNGSSNDGTATITTTNGLAPFSYTLNGVTNGTGIFTGLASGQYTAVVTDNSGCTASVSVSIGIAQPFTAQESHTDVVCNDGSGTSNDGTATITTTNGVAPFSYTLNGVTNGTGIFTGLASGQYTAVVTDNSGCTASVSVSIGIAQPFTAQESHTDVICNDDNGSSNDGTATITTTNGVAPFSYTLNGVTNGTGIFTGLASGQYTSVVTDNSGCTASVSVSIGIAQPFTAQESHTDVVCNDDNGSSNDGTATITTTNGVAPFSYTLNGVTNGTGIFTGLANGQYTAVVTDNSGCTASVSVSIGIAQPFTAQESHTDVICNDDNGSSNDGTATITTTNGIAPFSYTLNGVANGTGIFTGLASGQYTAVVTDNSGCTASVSVSIGIAQPFTAQESHTDVVCNDDNGSSNDGTATITTTNGVAPFSYTLNGVTNGTGIFTGLASGQYTAVVTDNSGCTASVSVSIGIAQPFTAQESHSDVVCNDDNGSSNDGTATITTTNGVAPFSYTLNGVTNGTGVFTGLASGQYTAVVTDATGCSASVSVSIGIAQPFTAQESHTDVVCNDDNGSSNDGTATITTTNGIAPFSYTLNGVTNGTGIFTGLASGQYTAVVTDNNGCTASVSVSIGIAQPFTAQESHTDVVCNDDNGSSNDGTATITTNNGVGPFSYTLNGVTNGTGVFTELASGQYTAVVTDANRCSASVSVSIGIAQPFTAQESHTDVICNDDNGSSNDGIATITTTNGVAPFSYTLNGVTNGTGVFNGLASGQYTAVVTDASGCSASVSVSIGIAQLFTAQESHTDVVCNDDNGSSNDGTATITTTNGVAPFSYTLNGVTNGTGVFTGLASGQYTAVVTDASGCTASVSVSIGIAQPFTAQESHTDVICNDDNGSSNDGTATITTTNGVAPFSYTLNGVTNGTGIFTGLASGQYTAVVTDNSGCTASVSVSIGIAQPFTAQESHTDVICNDDNGSSNDGTATITTTNGVAPFSYTLNGVTNGTGIFTGLASGQYTSVVTDNSGCTASVSVSIGIAQPFTAQESHTDVVCNDDNGSSNDGTATITTTNGVAPFSYTLNGVTNGTGIFTGLASGQYTAVVTDNSGCTASVSVSIGIAPPFTAQESHTDVVCNDDNGSSNDGTATITTTNGVAPFSYTLNGVTNGTGVFTGLASGQYTAVVTDNSGCTASVSVSIGIAQPFTAQESHTDVICNDDNGSSNDGTATITTTNGIAPFSYTLNGVTNGTGIFTGLASGQYTAVVTDNSGCTASVSVSIGIAQPFTAQESHTDVVCNDDNGSSNDGTATITTTNGVGPFIYTLNGVTNGTGIFTGLASGQYTAVVTDNSGCTASVSVSIGIAQPFTAQESHTDIICNDDNGSSNDGTATLTVTNGVAPLTYTLDGISNSTGVFTGLSAGTFVGTVLDANGCTASVSVTIGIAEQFTASEIHTDVICNDKNGSSNDGTATITANNGVGPFSYTLNGVTNGTGNFSDLAPGLYTATVTDANGCVASVEVNIEQPRLLLITETNVPVTCIELGSIDVTVTGGTPPYQYLWNTGVTTEDISGLNVGLYSISVMDKNGCHTSLNINLGGNVFDSIVPTTSVVAAIIPGEEPISVCLEQELELDGPIANVFICQEPTNILYEFVFDENSVCFDIERLNDDEATDTICVITCDATECAPCDTTYIIVVVLPIGNGSPIVPDACIEVTTTDPITIDALADVIDPDNDALTITEITDGPEYGTATISTDGQSIDFRPDFGYCGRDTIYFEVCDARGLCSNGFICITIECECYIPNVITPNNDGLNDFFNVPCLEEIDNGFLRVYNRWGNEVYRNENYKNDWDGYYKGNPLPDGTYYYVLEFTDQQGQFRNLAGDLTILK